MLRRRDNALITSDERIARSLRLQRSAFSSMRNVAVGRPAPGARKRWRGDDEHRLPAQKVEPYRLWFEFLKLASKDPEIQIDKRFYQRWGSFDADFDDWWSAHWRDLFSVDIGVRVCGPAKQQRNASKAISYSEFLSIKIRSGPSFRSPNFLIRMVLASGLRT